MSEEKKLIAYKGFDKDLKCKGFQYKVGEVYEHDGPVKACNSGFHACERPLDVLTYYPPARSRFCVVEQFGTVSRDGSDSKAASSKIKIGAEIGIPGLVKAQIEYVKDHTTTEYTDPDKATAGDSGAATAGYKGAATAGNFGAATAGNCGAATAGDSGAATAGNCGAATSRGAVSVGENGAGLVRGNGVKVRGGIGAVLVIVEENEDSYDIAAWKAIVVDGDVIKADTWYCLKNGQLVQA